MGLRTNKGVILFEDPDAADEAMELDGKELLKKKLTLTLISYKDYCLFRQGKPMKGRPAPIDIARN